MLWGKTEDGRECKTLARFFICIPDRAGVTLWVMKKILFLLSVAVSAACAQTTTTNATNFILPVRTDWTYMKLTNPIDGTFRSGYVLFAYWNVPPGSLFKLWRSADSTTWESLVFPSFEVAPAGGIVALADYSYMRPWFTNIMDYRAQVLP